MRFVLIAALAVVASAVPALTVRAAEPLTVLCAGAASSVVEQIGHDFERTHGRSVVVTEGTAGQITAKLAAGAHVDVVILSAPALDALTTNGGIVTGTRVDLGKTGIGVGIRQHGRIRTRPFDAGCVEGDAPCRALDRINGPGGRRIERHLLCRRAAKDGNRGRGAPEGNAGTGRFLLRSRRHRQGRALRSEH